MMMLKAAEAGLVSDAGGGGSEFAPCAQARTWWQYLHMSAARKAVSLHECGRDSSIFARVWARRQHLCTSAGATAVSLHECGRDDNIFVLGAGNSGAR